MAPPAMHVPANVEHPGVTGALESEVLHAAASAVTTTKSLRMLRPLPMERSSPIANPGCAGRPAER
jgi:hypothetical protein